MAPCCNNNFYYQYKGTLNNFLKNFISVTFFSFTHDVNSEGSRRLVTLSKSYWHGFKELVQKIKQVHKICIWKNLKPLDESETFKISNLGPQVDFISQNLITQTKVQDILIRCPQFFIAIFIDYLKLFNCIGPHQECQYKNSTSTEDNQEEEKNMVEALALLSLACKLCYPISQILVHSMQLFHPQICTIFCLNSTKMLEHQRGMG